MTRIVIVDDEMLVRLGIRSLIDWEKHGFEVAGEADNGRDALETIARTHPDILITDIVMPEMDGLELIAQVRRKYPFIHILVLSCYNDYKYVRLALKQGADDYILKASMKPDDLLRQLLEMKDTLDSGAQKARSRDGSSLADASDALRRLLEMEYSSDQEPQEIQMLPGAGLTEKVIAAVRIHCFGMLKCHPASAEKALIGFLQQEQAQPAPLRAVCATGSGGLAMLLDGSDPQQLEAFLEQTIVYAHKYLRFRISIGASPCFYSPQAFSLAYRQARASLQRSFYSHEGGLFAWAEPKPAEADVQTLRAEDWARLDMSLERAQAADCSAFLNGFFQWIERTQPPASIVVQMFLDVVVRIDAELKRYGIAPFHDAPAYQSAQMFDFYHQLSDWLRQISGFYCRSVTAARQKMYRREILKLIEYLRQHYDRNITLNWAAEYVHMSENYLCRVFKAETGQNFVEYLTALRIEKAVEMMKNSDLLVYEIAERVGYPNINYFGRAFKKIVGKSPNQFRGGLRKDVGKA